RIIGLNLLDQKTGRHARRNANALWGRDFRDIGLLRDDAADHAARRASWNAARDTARHAASTQIRGRFLFLNHLNLFWNLGGSTQLAVDHFALHLHHLTTAAGGGGGGGGGGGRGGGATRKVISCVLGSASV